MRRASRLDRFSRPGEISSIWLSSLGCGVFDRNVQLGVAEVRSA